MKSTLKPFLVLLTIIFLGATLLACGNESAGPAAEKKNAPAAESATKSTPTTAQPSSPPAGDKTTAATPAGVQPPAPPRNPTDAVVRINGSPVTQAEYDAEKNRLMSELAASGKAPAPEQMNMIESRALDNLIGQELLYQDGQARGFKAEETDIEQRMKEVRAQFPSENEFKQALAEIQLTEDALRQHYRRTLIVDRLIKQEFVDKITISDQDARQYYDTHPEAFKVPERAKVSHILIQWPAKATDEQKKEARTKIEALRKELEGGKDFATLAKDNSSCPSKAQGGDLGFIRRGQTVKPFEDAAFALAPGQLSDVVETQFGYHLIKMFEKKPAGASSFEEVQEAIKSRLNQEKLGQQLVAHVTGLKEKAKVETVGGPK